MYILQIQIHQHQLYLPSCVRLDSVTYLLEKRYARSMIPFLITKVFYKLFLSDDRQTISHSAKLLIREPVREEVYLDWLVCLVLIPANLFFWADQGDFSAINLPVYTTHLHTTS